jgi:type II secretion system protein H
MKVMHNKRMGFALLEVLVVVLIIGILASLIIPNMGRGSRGVRIKTTARDIINIMRMARESAIREQSIFLVRVDFVEQVIHLSDAFGDSIKKYPLNAEFLKVESVRIEGAEARRADQVDILFYPEGNATASDLVLRVTDSSQRITLRTDPVTGIARVVTERQDGRS